MVKYGSYTFDQVRQMRDILASAQIIQPITFPIRAGLSTSVESRENILWLLNQVCCNEYSFQSFLYLLHFHQFFLTYEKVN